MNIGESQKLPTGWRRAKLGDVAVYHNGRAFKPEDWATDGKPIIRIQNLNTPTAAYNFFRGEVDSRNAVVDGDLLISWSASLDAFLWDRGSAVLNQHIFKVEEYTDKIDRRYLYFAVKEAMAEIRDQVHGATMKHITKPEFEAIQIPLPPLPEQKRIAAILTDQIATVEKARTAAEARLKAAKELPAAYLREVFESEEAQGWPRIALGDAGEVVSGVTLGRKLNDAKLREVPYLRVANVKDGHLDLSDVKTIEVTESELQRWRLQSGDLLLTEGGDPDKLGRGSFWSEEIPECIHQNHIFRVRFPKDRFLPEFLSAQMSSTYGKAYFLAHAKQTTGIATINQQVLKAFPLLVPSIEVQRQLSESITSKITAANKLSSMLEEELAAIKSMPAALLRQAFAGEL